MTLSCAQALLPQRASMLSPRMCRWLLGACLCLSPWLAWADSWLPASTQIETSANGKARVTIEPRQLSSNLAYFHDKVEGTANAGQLPGGRDQASARVEHQDANGQWQLLWQGPLVNEVAPVDALLSNDGRYLVTLDNWHAMGFGDNAIVIYDGKGQRLHQLSLRQVLPREYVMALPRSVSSLQWRGNAALSRDGEVLEIPLALPVDDEEEDDDEAHFVPLKIRLADAKVTLPSGRAWHKAMRMARAEVAAQRADYEQFLRSHSAPLPTPATSSIAAWKTYATEVMVRMGARGEVKILAAPEAADRLDSRQAIDDLITQMGDPNAYVSRIRNWALASPDPHGLEEVATRALREVPPASARHMRVIFIGLPEQQARMTALFEAAGAGFHFIDMSQPVPGMQAVPFDER